MPVGRGGGVNSVCVKGRRALHHPYPRALCTLLSFARIKKPKWWPVEINGQHLRSHGKIGDCEQSMFVGSLQIISRLDSQNKFQIFTLFSGRHKRASPTWRLHTGLCKFGQNILTNIWSLGKRRDLKLGEVSSLPIYYNITIPWFYPLNMFSIPLYPARKWCLVYRIDQACSVQISDIGVKLFLRLRNETLDIQPPWRRGWSIVHLFAGRSYILCSGGGTSEKKSGKERVQDKTLSLL